MNADLELKRADGSDRFAIGMEIGHAKPQIAGQGPNSIATTRLITRRWQCNT